MPGQYAYKRNVRRRHEGESDGKSVHGQVTSVWVVILVILPGLIRETDLEKMYKYPENRIQIIEKHSLPCVVLYGLVLPCQALLSLRYMHHWHARLFVVGQLSLFVLGVYHPHLE